MHIKKISSFLSVSSQIYPANIEEIAAAGFKTIINNRPDMEADDQPLADELAAEATRFGLIMISHPVIAGLISEEDVACFAGDLEAATGPVLAFCRTGTRCTILWAMNEARHRDVDDILTFAKSIGYDLSGHREEFDEIASEA